MEGCNQQVGINNNISPIKRERTSIDAYLSGVKYLEKEFITATTTSVRLL